ncbi:MAG: BlaI/MecI/CopY family transcriptional regulator [Sedimentisphaerales bacterium]|nr:BlaI/MecI/CopY family transcriptional regulator [Sedimentisphaerales bacterium]
MIKQHKVLGELELAVLKAIWENQPCTVQQVAKILGQKRGCARTTVLTVMQRLHAKNILKRHKNNGVFQYSTTEGRTKVISRMIGQFLDKVLDGSALPFVAYLSDTKDLTKEQADTLRAIVEKLEKK